MFIKKIIQEIIYRMPHKQAHSLVYAVKHGGKRLDYQNPKTYDEKIHWHMAFTYDTAYAVYADKYAVRKYVERCGLKDILIPLAGGPYESFEEIDFDALPDQFILKTTHASGADHYEICKDKALADRERLKKKFDRALRINYAKQCCEYQYAGVTPRILCEKLLHEDADRLSDYKVVCTYGKPVGILVCYQRDQGRDYYSPSWEYLEYTKTKFHSTDHVEKPACLKEMLDAAGRLSEPFPLARIDFYVVEGKLYFGEITLSPSGGDHANLTDFGQTELGRQVPPFKK